MAVIEIRCFCICRLCILGAAGPSVVEAVAAARFATAARLSLGYHQPSSYHLQILKTLPRRNLQCQANQGSAAWVSSLWDGRGGAGGQTSGGAASSVHCCGSTMTLPTVFPPPLAEDPACNF